MEKEIKSLKQTAYIAPAIEVVEIQIEQNILTSASGGAGLGGAGLGGTDFEPVEW